MGMGSGALSAAFFVLRRTCQPLAYNLSLATPEGSELGAIWNSSGIGPVIPLREIRCGARNEAGDISARLLLPSAWRLMFRAFWLARVSTDRRVDIVIANSFWTHFDAALAGLLSGTPTVLYLHEEFESGLASWAVRAALRLSTAAIAVSNGVTAHLGRSRRLRVIRNGIDETQFRPGPPSPHLRAELTKDPSLPLIVTICRLDEVKQVDHVLRAASLLEEPLDKISVAIVGETSTDNDYASSIVTLGEELLGERVRFLGRRDDICEIPPELGLIRSGRTCRRNAAGDSRGAGSGLSRCCISGCGR